MHTAPPCVISINISPGGIPKLPVERAEITVDGIVGDGHNHEKHITPLQALNLLDEEDLVDLAREGFAVHPGAMGENITCRRLDVDALEVGRRLRFSGGVEVQITKRRSPCYVLDAIDPTLKKAAVGRAGMYVRILRTGVIKPGETIEVIEHAATD